MHGKSSWKHDIPASSSEFEYGNVTAKENIHI